MDSRYLERLFGQANSLQLLRDNKAVIVLSFLHTAFAGGRKAIAQDELAGMLAEYLREFDEREVFDEAEEGVPSSSLFDRYQQRARNLLRDWEHTRKRYLRGTNNAEGQYEYSITEHVQRAWQWLESLEQREVTGARSRLDDIFEKIRRAVENSREKTDEERIAELRQKQQELEVEINDIAAGKRSYKPFDSVRMREEYDGLLEQIRALSTDFKTLEGHFEHIRMDMLRQQATRQGSKGSLLGAALDARDALDRTPQGLSFVAFFEELRDQQRTRLYESRVQEFLKALDERQIPHNNDQPLVRLYRFLLREAEPVLDANRRIADRIMRMVAENASLDRQLLRERISEVKALLLDTEVAKANIDGNQDFWTIESDRASVYLPLEKSLNIQNEQQKSGFAQPQAATNSDMELPMFSDEDLLLRVEAYLKEALSTADQQTLAQLAERYPLEAGLAEVLAYLNIMAIPRNAHFIDPGQNDIFLLDAAPQQYLEGPRVIFNK